MTYYPDPYYIAVYQYPHELIVTVRFEPRPDGLHCVFSADQSVCKDLETAHGVEAMCVRATTGMCGVSVTEHGLLAIASQAHHALRRAVSDGRLVCMGGLWGLE